MPSGWVAASFPNETAGVAVGVGRKWRIRSTARPTVITSPSASSSWVTCTPLTKVPLVDPRSSIHHASSRRTKRACFADSLRSGSVMVRRPIRAPQSTSRLSARPTATSSRSDKEHRRPPPNGSSPSSTTKRCGLGGTRPCGAPLCDSVSVSAGRSVKAAPF